MPPPAPSTTPGAKLRLAGYLTAGAGVASIGASVVLGLRAHAAYADVHQLSHDRGQWTSGYETKLAHADRDRTLAIAFGALGGAALASGAVLSYLGWRAASTEAVAILPTEGGAVATWLSVF